MCAAGIGTKELDDRQFWRLTLRIFSSSLVKIAENIVKS
jgi:hypothetical protein